MAAWERRSRATSSKRSVSGHRGRRNRTRTLVFLTTAGLLPARTLTRAAIVTALCVRMRAAPFLLRRTTSLAFAPGAILVLSVPTRVTDAAAACAPPRATVDVTLTLHFGPVAGQLTCRPVSSSS